MNARFSKVLFVVMLAAALTLPVLETTPSARAQTNDNGRTDVRIGYFAFDPYEVDTLVDGQLAPGGGWKEGWWLCFYPGQDYPYVVWGYAATPYLVFPSGAHEIAFVPKGENPDAAILGPQEVVFEAGHRYELAVIGEQDDGSLSLLVIDETTVFAEADPQTDFMGILVNDIKGAPPVELKVDYSVKIESLAYGQFDMYLLAGEDQSTYMSMRTKGTLTSELMSFTTVAIPSGISEFAALIGSVPGAWGPRYSLVSNWWYVTDARVIDGGPIAVGDEIAGEIDAFGTRIKYALTLDVDTSLNLYAKATGPRTGDESGMKFDPILYVYDAQGNTLFWNDESSIAYLSLDSLGVFDAGLEGIDLAAGDYTIEVGGAYDFNSGPYVLIVESAASE